MTRHLSLFIGLLILFMSKIGLAQDLQFYRAIGGSQDDGLYDLVTDQEGNIFVIGWFSGTIDLDPGAQVLNANSNGNRDIFFSKYDSSGNHIWSVSLGSGGQDEGSVLTVDSSGNVIVAGRFSNTIDFNPGATINSHSSNGNRDIYVCKFNPNGQYVWSRTFGGSGYDDAEDVEVDDLGNIFITGSFQNTVDFNPDPGFSNFETSNGIDDAYLLKVDSAGLFKWVKTFGGAGQDELSVLKIIDSKELYVGGYFTSTTTFSPGVVLVSSGNADAFLAKFDTSANFHWVKSFGGTSFDAVYGMDISAEKLYLTGAFSGTADLNPSVVQSNFTSAGLYDSFFSSFDTSGNFNWARICSSTGYDIGEGVAIVNDSIVMFNTFFSATAFVSGVNNSMTLNSSGGYDLANCFYDNSGELRSLFTMSSKGAENTHTSYAIDGNTLWISGYFGDTIDFDPSATVNTNTVNNGITDVFFSKYLFECDSDFSVFSLLPSPVACGNDTLTVRIINGSVNSIKDWFIPSGWVLVSNYNDSVLVIPNTSSGVVSCRQRNNCYFSDTMSVFVTVVPPVTSSAQFELCSGDTFHLPGVGSFVNDTILFVTYAAASGCDSIVTMQVDFLNKLLLIDSVVICSNESYVVGGNTYSLPGIYNDTLTSFIGCDSIITTVLSVLPYSDFVAQALLCEGDSIVINNHIYSDNGVYVDTLVNINGCDSILTTHVIVYPVNFISNTINICQGDFYSVGGSVYTSSGIYVDTLQSGFGCDSIVRTVLFVNPTSIALQSVTICEGESVTVGSNSYFTSGIYSDTLQSVSGCDSIVVTSLSINDVDSTVVCLGSVCFAQQGGAIYQWFTCDSTGNNTLSGETGQYLSLTSPGYYGVSITDNGCIDSSACIYSGIVGIHDVTDENLFQIVPNPAFESFTIKGEYQKILLSLIDVNGRSLSRKEMVQGDYFYLKNIAPGIYFVRIENDKSVNVIKLLVN